MKKIKLIILYIVSIVIAFIAGWSTFNWYYNVDDLFDAYMYRGKVIQYYEECINDSINNNNNNNSIN